MKSKQFTKNPNIDEFRKELKFTTSLHTLNEVRKIFKNKRLKPEMHIETIPLNSCKDWQVSNVSINHKSGDFFKIEGVRVKQSKNREVGEGGWDQPILTQIGFDGGIVGLIRSLINGFPHYLINFKEEPGNYKIVQISPTLQATFANLNRAHGGEKPLFAEYFQPYQDNYCDKNLLYRTWFSEDGGRLLNKRNLGMIIHSELELNKSYEENFMWLTLRQIKELIQEDAWINPHLRSLVSHI